MLKLTRNFCSTRINMLLNNKKKMIKSNKYPSYIYSKSYEKHNKNIPLFITAKNNFHTITNLPNYINDKSENVKWREYNGNIMLLEDYTKYLEKDNNKYNDIINRLHKHNAKCNEMLMKYKNKYGVI